MNNLIYYIALGISVIIGVSGQLLLKAGAIQTQQNSGSLFFQPQVIIGLFLYFIAALFYIYSLKTIPVSIAFPTVSLSYILAVLFAHFLWKEPFGVYQIIALLFITFGVFLLNYANR